MYSLIIMIHAYLKDFQWESKIQTGNLLEQLTEPPTSLLVEAEEDNILK